MKLLNKVIAMLLIACLSVNGISSYAYAANSVGADYVPPQCENVNPTNLRTELANIIQASFNRDIDIEKKVNSQWMLLHLNDAIDSEIDKAADVVSRRTGVGAKIRSNWSKDKIKELTNEIVELAFDSPSSEVKSRLTNLSKQVADELFEKVNQSATSSTYQAMNCIQKFIGQTYSQTMLNMFDKYLVSLSQGVEPSTSYENSDLTLGEVNRGKVTGAVGIGVVLTIVQRKVIRGAIERITGRIGLDIGERLFERLAFLEIPFIGEVIIGVLTLWDVVQGFNGALPIIQDKLKEPELKLDVRQRIISVFESELRNESSQIVGGITNEVYSQWIDFKGNYKQTLEMAEGSPKFRNILDRTNEQEQQKLFSLVGLLLNVTGRNQLLVYIEDGTFERLFALPASAYQMLTNADKVPTLIQWVDLAGDKLDKVISTDLYKHLSPRDLDRQLLTEILSVQDPATISKLVLLDISSIRRLLVISKQNLIALAIKLSPNDLQLISGYFDGLEQIEVNRIVKFLLDEKMPDSSVISHIVKSRNISAAIQFWKQPTLLNGIVSLLIGDIYWELFTDKYGLLILLPLAFFALPILLFALWYYRPNKKQDSQELKES